MLVLAARVEPVAAVATGLQALTALRLARTEASACRVATVAGAEPAASVVLPWAAARQVLMASMATAAMAA